MGWEVRDLGPMQVSVRLDSHGGDREREDEALAEELSARLHDAVVAVLRDEKYARILVFEPEYYGPGG